MKILIIQQAGHHQINRHFRESLCLEYGFKKLGHETIVWGDKYDNFTKESFDDLERWCDVIFVIENYFFDWIPSDKINESKKIKVWWTIDSHASLLAHKNFANKIIFDIILSSTERYLSEYTNAKTYWFPNCYPDNLIYPHSDSEKSTTFGFCGSLLPIRMPRINYMKENYNLQVDAYVMGDEMVSTIGSYFLHFNQNIGDDINYRTFETTGCRTALITNYTNKLETLFDLDTELLTYKSENDLYELLDRYLEDQESLLRIAHNGFKRASNNHTYTNRCQKFLEIINNG